MAQRGTALQEGVPGARRKEPEHRVRGRRSRAGRRHVDPVELRQPGRDLPLRLAHVRRASRSTTSSSTAFVDGDEEAAGRRPAGRRDRRGRARSASAHRARCEGYVELAKEEGGDDPHRRKAPGESARARPGRLLPGADGDHRPRLPSRVIQEEIFGPVVTVTPVRFCRDEAIAYANGTRYGLSASVWTRDLPAGRIASPRRSTAERCGSTCWLLRDLRVPFGGMKESGVGREGGFDSLDFFTEAKNVCVKL